MSYYFASFPQIAYTLDDGASYQPIQDILRRAVIVSELVSNSSNYSIYDIQDGETPEMLAHRFYGHTKYHWIILHANEILDPVFDWPLSTQNLIEYCKNKYGYDKLYDIHHYERIVNDGEENEMRLVTFTVDAEYPETITNWEYEEELNDNKRRIKIINPSVVPELAVAFQKIIRL